MFKKLKNGWNKMNNKHLLIFVGFAAVILIILAGSNNFKISNVNTTSEPNNSLKINKIEVIHFHGTQQCYSCITVGKYAEDTINTYFAEEVKSGKISFAHINVDSPENLEIVKKYGVTSASLWIGVYNENGFHKEQNLNVWYKIDNKEDYMNYLKDLLEKKLQGA
jgi:hypothetical protein